MKRRKPIDQGILCLFIVLFLSGLLGGWALGAEKAKEALPKTLNLATHPIGSMVNSLANGLATVLSKHLQTSVKVMPTTGPTEWLPMADSGEIDMGVLNNWDAQMGRLGKEEYAAATGGKGARISLLCSGIPALNGMVVSERSGIKKGSDLKGKSVVCTFTGARGVTGQARAALANWGLQLQDVKCVSVPGVEAGIKGINEGRIDASLTNAGAGVVAELDATKGALFLSFDPSPEALKRMHEHFPCYIVQTMPGPGLAGIKGPTNLMAYDFYLVGSDKLSEGAAYQIVKALWEYDKELAPLYVRLKDWTKDRYVTPKASIPYHPGAVAFYKEIGAWQAEMDNVQKRLLEKK